MSGKAAKIVLTELQKTELEIIKRSKISPQRLIERTQIILLARQPPGPGRRLARPGGNRRGQPPGPGRRLARPGRQPPGPGRRLAANRPPATDHRGQAAV